MEPQEQNSAAIMAMQSRKFRIPGDVVNRATADLQDDHRSAIRWLHAHASENDLALPELAKLIRYDASTLYRVFYGKYEGRLDNVVQEISDFRRLHEERAKSKKLSFIETGLARKIWRICDAALEYQRVAFIFGDTQIGKTSALERYRDDHNHGSTILVRMPTGGAMTNFLEEMAIALRISPQSKEKELRRRILSAFDSRMLLIVDEAHQCVFGQGAAARPVRTIDFVRELFDKSGCGLVICATNVFRDEMETGRFAGLLKQTKRRRLAALQLPNIPLPSDLNTFAAAYGLEPAKDEAIKLQTEMLRDEGLGMWLTLLRMGAKIASKANKRMVWGHVIAAHAGLRKLEQMEAR